MWKQLGSLSQISVHGLRTSTAEIVVRFLTFVIFLSQQHAAPRAPDFAAQVCERRQLAEDDRHQTAAGTWRQQGLSKTTRSLDTRGSLKSFTQPPSLSVTQLLVRFAQPQRSICDTSEKKGFSKCFRSANNSFDQGSCAFYWSFWKASVDCFWSIHWYFRFFQAKVLKCVWLNKLKENWTKLTVMFSLCMFLFVFSVHVWFFTGASCTAFKNSPKRYTQNPCSKWSACMFWCACWRPGVLRSGQHAEVRNIFETCNCNKKPSIQTTYKNLISRRTEVTQVEKHLLQIFSLPEFFWFWYGFIYKIVTHWSFLNETHCFLCTSLFGKCAPKQVLKIVEQKALFVFFYLFIFFNFFLTNVKYLCRRILWNLYFGWSRRDKGLSFGSANV